MRWLRFRYSKKGFIASSTILLIGLAIFYSQLTCKGELACGVEALPLLLPLYFLFMILWILLSLILSVFQIPSSQISFLDYGRVVLPNLIIWEVAMLTLYVVLTYKLFARK